MQRETQQICLLWCSFNEDLVLTEPFTILAGSNPRFLDIWSQSRFTLLDNKNRCQAMWPFPSNTRQSRNLSFGSTLWTPRERVRKGAAGGSAKLMTGKLYRFLGPCQISVSMTQKGLQGSCFMLRFFLHVGCTSWLWLGSQSFLNINKCFFLQLKMAFGWILKCHFF